MAKYDIAALKADLPNAKELSQFVYDKTGVALDLVGKAKEDQYTVAKAVLEGKEVPEGFLTDLNPYIDKKELIPEDPIAPIPPREKTAHQKIPASITLVQPICHIRLILSQTEKLLLTSVNTRMELLHSKS